MTNLTQTRLTEIAEGAYFSVRSYSGRGMYGKQCVGISSDEGTNDFLAQIIEQCDDVEEAAELVREMSTDSLGRGTIYYWPGVEWQKVEEFFAPEDDEAMGNEED